MRVGVISLLPPMFNALEQGITGRALSQGLLELRCWDPRDFTHDTYRTVDDRPYGGGAGMVMLAEPLHQAIQAAKTSLGATTPVIYLSPQGIPLTQAIIKDLSLKPELILLCGRYEGIDERIVTQTVTHEYSIGDYVISGGELAAMVLIDAMTRLLPNALGHPASAEQDSFSQGLLDYPHYTRPACFNGVSVPEVLRSGDHQAIARWRQKQALGRTWLRRPDLLRSLTLTASDQALLQAFIDESTAKDPHST